MYVEMILGGYDGVAGGDGNGLHACYILAMRKDMILRTIRDETVIHGMGTFASYQRTCRQRYCRCPQ